MDTHFVSHLHASKQPRCVRDPFSPHMVGKSSPYICRGWTTMDTHFVSRLHASMGQLWTGTTMDTHFVSRLHASKQPRLVRDPFSPHMVGKSSPYICRAERRSSKPSPFLHHRPPALDVDSQMRACIHEMPVPCVLWRTGDGSDRGRQYLQIIGAVQPTRLILACHHMRRGYRADADHETGQGLLFWLPSVVSGLLMQQLLATVRAIPARIGLRST